MAKEVFFHVGLGKTGTTYLQYRVFPKLRGINYIQRIHYRDYKYVKFIENGPEGTYLVSNEFDKQLEQEAKKIAGKYPGARIIVVLRRQDSWIASQYRRFVKNGYPGSFEEFIDVDQDQGFWRRDDLYFHRKLEMLEQLFGSRPLVLFQDELIRAPHDFIGKICSFIGASYDPASINLKRKHSSYNEKQLKVRRAMSARNPQWPRKGSEIYWIRKIQNYSRMPKRYFSLYLALLVPARWVDSHPLISIESLEKVREFYADDWEKCEAYSSTS